jgi:hypothetical protein
LPKITWEREGSHLPFRSNVTHSKQYSGTANFYTVSKCSWHPHLLVI